MLHIAIIMNDTPSMHKPLESERGLSMLVEYDDFNILLDTGYDGRFIENAHKMGHSLEDLNSVILSHAHFDHVAGYASLIEKGLAPKTLFIGPHFFEPKYIKNGPVFINLNSSLSEQYVISNGIQINEVTEALKLSNGLFLVTCSAKTPYAQKIPTTHVRYTGKRFTRDQYEDEIALVAETKQGLIVLTGSCHRGICNVVSYIRSESHKPIAAVIGGMRPAFSQKEFKFLEESGVKFLGICNDDISLENIPKTTINVAKVALGDEFFF